MSKTCTLPSYSDKDKVSIVTRKSDDANSLVKRILKKDWVSFTIDKDNCSDTPETFEDSTKLFIVKITEYLKSKGISNDIVNEVKKQLEVELFSDIPEVTPEEDISAEIPDADLDDKNLKIEKKLSQLIKAAFGNDRILLEGFYSDFNHSMFQKLIIDIQTTVENSTIITNVRLLNDAIIDYQNRLHKVVYLFLKENGLLPEGKPVTNMFGDFLDGVQNINPLYSDNMNAFLEYIDSIEDLLKSVSDSSQTHDKKLLKAVNAYFLLLYFDELLLKSLGKYLYINLKQTLPIIKDDKGIITYKYSINKKNVNMASSWQDLIRDGIGEIGSFSQLVIEQIPIIGTIKYLDKASLVISFQKLKYAINRLISSTGKDSKGKLKEALTNKDTVGSWKEILGILHKDLIGNGSDSTLRKALIESSSDNHKEKSKLRDSDFNIFESVYLFLFNGNNGVYNIERLHWFDGSNSVSAYDITQSLFSTINATTLANYLLVSTRDGKKISLKLKYNSRRKAFLLNKSINEKVFREVKPSFLSQFSWQKSSIGSYNGNIEFINIGTGENKKTFIIDLNTSTSFGIFDESNTFFDRTKVLLRTGNSTKEIELDKYFRDFIQEIFSESGRQKVLNNDNGEYSEFINFLEEISDKLNVDFLSLSGLQKLRILNDILGKNTLHKLYITAARVAAAYDINSKFKDAVNNPNEGDNVYSSFDIINFLKDTNSGIYNGMLSLKYNSNILYNYVGGTYIAGMNRFSEVLDAISDAEVRFEGGDNKSTTKNFEGHNIPNISVFFTDIIQEFRNQEGGNATDMLMFSGGNSRMIIDTDIDTDVEIYGETKSVNQFSTPELFYHFFVNKFIYGMTQLGTYISQPVVYSDKNKFINFDVIWSDISYYTDDKDNPFAIMPNTHILAMYETQGSYYKNIFDSVAEDYKKIFGNDYPDILKLNNVEVFIRADLIMKNMSKHEFIQRAYENNVKIIDEYHYREIKIKDSLTGIETKRITPNETLYYYYTKIFASQLNLKNFLDKEKIKYINQLINKYVVIYSDSTILSALEKSLLRDDLKNEYKPSDWVDDGILVLAKYNGRNIVLGEEIPLDATNVVINPLLESYFYFHNVIDNNIKLGISGHELHHTVKALKEILSDVNKGTGLNFTSFIEADTSLLTDVDLNILHLKLEEAHYKIISLAQGAQFKRTVPIPGTIKPFDQNTLKGITSEYKVAIIEDIKAKTHDFSGNKGFENDSSDVDAHDGSAFEDPFTSILENYSLGDSPVGDVKKPLWDIDMPDTGVRKLVKYAVNTITNRIMKQSLGSSLNMYNMFKKMTNSLTWKDDEIDLIDDWAITEGYDYNTSFANNILDNEPLFYEHNGKYYQILNFGKEEINGEKVYYTLEDNVDEFGTSYGNVPYKVYHYFDSKSRHIKIKEGEIVSSLNYHTIQSLFELHASLGGIESMSLVNKKLVESEASNKAVANFMIYVSLVNTDVVKNLNEDNTNYLNKLEINQTNFYQPLKHKIINCLINKSAIKNGASCVNSVDRWYDEEDLMYDTFSTLKYGIQQDSDHDADEGKVSEMTQVISALDATGLYHDEVKEIYEVLGKQTINAAKIELDAVLSDNPDKLYEIVGKTLVKNISLDQKGLVRSILYQIRKNLGLSSNYSLSKFKIPFSDANVYSKILQVMGNILNKKSIKRKYSGLGMVMVPAYDIYQVWEIEGKKYLYKDLLERGIKYNQTLGENERIKDTGDPIEFNKLIVEQYLEHVFPDKVLYDYSQLNKESVSLIFLRNPELSDIGTEEEYSEYISTIFPDSKEKSIYWHGSDSDFSRGFEAAERGKGSGAPETKSRNDFYLAKQAWSVLLYVTGINRNSVDKNGFGHWNKLWWELKEIMSNGRRENDKWKDLVIGPDTVRQEIPNKKGVFNRNEGGNNGKWLKERKADYGYENKSDKEFFEDILGIQWGVDTFRTWTERNAEIFKSLLQSKGIYPVVINTSNPIIEKGLNTYYEELRGLFTKADLNNNDAILSNESDNEFGSDVGIVINASNQNVHFLGTSQDIELFRQWKESKKSMEDDILTDIDPEDVIDITYVDNNDKSKVVTIKLDTLPKYYSFKSNIHSFLLSKGYDVKHISRISKNSRVPRNLAPMRIHFIYEVNGKQYRTNIYDTWPYVDMINLMKIGTEESKKQIKEYLKNVIPIFLANLEKGIVLTKVKNPDGSIRISADGRVIQMNKLKAEVIMSSVYKSKFGLNDGDELVDIMEQGPKYFLNKIKYLPSDIYEYDFQLVTKNGNNNIYISLDLFSKDNENYQTKYISWKPENFSKEVVKETDGSNNKVMNRIYIVDSDNIKQFEIGRDIDVSDEIYYDLSTEQYKDIKTREVVSGRKFFNENGKVLEFILFLYNSEIKPKNGHSFKKYNIDRKRLNRVLLNEEKLDNAVTNVVDSLYKSDSFLMISPGNKVKAANYRTVKTIIRHLASRYKDDDLGLFLHNTWKNVLTHNDKTISNEEYVSLNGNTVFLENEAKKLGIDGKLLKLYGDKLLRKLYIEYKANKITKEDYERIAKYYNDSKLFVLQQDLIKETSKKQYSSFIKSLYFVSSRIPAQTLLSFMAMENIGFAGIETGYCAVSHFQTFLQGSDYDIDKSFMMGLNFDDNGIYLGWSKLFSYDSFEEIEASEELTFPKGTNYILTLNEDEDAIDISKEARVIRSIGELTVENRVRKIKILAQLLKRLNKESGNNKNVKVYISKDDLNEISAKDFVENYLIKHEKSEFGSNTDAVLKNFISANIQKQINKLGNLADAYTPVEIEALRDTLKYSDKQKESTEITLYNPAMVPIMQNTNMTGKSGTGIAANGQKGLFMWRFETLDTLSNENKNNDMVIFNVQIDNVKGRTLYNLSKKEGKELYPLESVKLNSLPDLGRITKDLKLSVLYPELKSDNVGSQYISAATDNAKELILYAINSGTKFMKCHLYLLSLGFDVKDIVSFMISTAVSFVDSISNENIFTGILIRPNDAINFARLYISLRKEYFELKELHDNTKTEDVESYKNNIERLKALEDSMKSLSMKGVPLVMLDAFKSKLNLVPVSDYDEFISDLNSLSNILLGANEFSSFAGLLGINLGIPLTKLDLISWKNRFKFIVNQANKNKGIVDKQGKILFSDTLINFYRKLYPDIFDDDGSINIKEASKKFGLKEEDVSLNKIKEEMISDFTKRFGDVIKFDTDAWLENKNNYRLRSSEYYNLVKHSINIFYFINSIPHYRSMFNIGNVINLIDRRICIKSLVSNHFNNLLREKYPYAPEDQEEKMLPVIDEIIIGLYLKSLGIEIKLKPEWEVYNPNYKIIKGQSVLKITKDLDISSFKHVFETHIIPELLQGTLLDNTEENNEIKLNPFIKSLMMTSDKDTPLYKADIDFMQIDSNEEVKRKYWKLVEAILQLKKYKYNNIPLSDLFMIYNIIVNKNRYGSERMTLIFEDFILDDDMDPNSSYIVRYFKNLGEEDYTKDMVDKIKSSVTLTDILTKIAPIYLDKKRAEHAKDPFIRIFTPGQGYEFYQYEEYKGYSRAPFEMLLDIPGESKLEKQTRQINFVENEFGLIYSNYISEVSANLKSYNYEIILSQLIQDRIITYDNIKCK